MRGKRAIAIGMATLLGAPGATLAMAGEKPTHGVAAGDVTSHSAIVWGRGGGHARMRVEVSRNRDFQPVHLGGAAWAVAAADYTADVRLEALRPATRYYYRVRFGGGPGEIGTFVTAPGRRRRQQVSFVWSADLGGQRYCRRPDVGYAIFSRMAELAPDFFVASGDMIYADGDCPAGGPDGPGGWENVAGDFPSILGVDWSDVATLREVYRSHWRYNRDDAAFQGFLRRTPVYAQWDDHEAIDDFGARWRSWNAATAGRSGFPNLVRVARETFFDYSPIGRRRDDGDRIYRRFSWGRDLDLLILDARSYRSRNDLPDRRGKTLLGHRQLRWLERSLGRSRATWKVVASDVPISIPTGSAAAVFGRDGWANGTLTDFSSQTGFEHELHDLLLFLDQHDVRNIVFITADSHWPTSIRYRTDVDGDGDTLQFHEIVAGPLSAVTQQPVALDPSFNPVTLYAEGGILNFGYARVEVQGDGQAHFIAEIRGEDGLPRPGSRIDLVPE